MSKKENLSSRESTISAARKLGQMARAFERKPGEDMIEFIRGNEKIAEALIQGAVDTDITRSEEEDK